MNVATKFEVDMTVCYRVMALLLLKNCVTFWPWRLGVVITVSFSPICHVTWN